MADQQYDVSPAQRRLLEDRARRRATLRAEFLKQISNPHVHATGDAGGVVSIKYLLLYNLTSKYSIMHFWAFYTYFTRCLFNFAVSYVK